jgi:hypothetical protein
MKQYQYLWLPLLLICTAQIKISAQLGNPRRAPTVDVRAAFTAFEGSNINVFSAKPDGSERKLIISEETELTNARAFDAIRAIISPAGDKIVYMIPARTGWAPVYVVESDGRNKKKVLDKAIDFHWTPDGKHILYSLFSPLPRGDGVPMWANGNDWYLLNLDTGKSDPVAVASDKLHYLVGWIRDTVALFASRSLFSSFLFEYDLKSRIRRESTHVGAGISINDIHTRGVGIAAHPDIGIYEFTPRLRRKNRLVSCKNYQCENIMWNGDDEIVYNKSTGPYGRININEAGASGYYVLFSIYKYNLKSRKESALARGSGKEVYRLEGILDNKAIIVSNESVPRTPRYILESRDLSGNVLHTLYASDKEMWFVGWLK